MRYIDLTRAYKKKKFRLYIGETGFIVERGRMSEEYLKETREDLKEAIKRNKKVDIIKYEEWLAGQSYIYPFPPTPSIRRDIELDGKMYPDPKGKTDLSTRIWVAESVEEIHKLIEEADERENMKKFEIFKHLL